MFLLFTSDYSPLYKKNALDIMCYPFGHVLRFRYQEDHVAASIRAYGSSERNTDSVLKQLGPDGVAIYAESDGSSGQQKFKFYPLRRVKILRIDVQGTVYYVDMELREFVNYDVERRPNAQNVLNALRDRLEQMSYHPLPPIPTNGEVEGLTWTANGQLSEVPVGYENQQQGYFFSSIEPALVLPTSEKSPNLAWESAVEILSQAPSMASAFFFLVPGLFKLRRRIPIFGKKREVPVKSISDGWTTRYLIPVGESVILKLLFYRSRSAAKLNPLTLTLNADKEAFAGVSERTIHVSSRYNEQRVELVSKRVFDSVIAPIFIETDQKNGILVPAPFLLAQLRVPKTIVSVILIGIVLAPTLLSLSPDFIRYVGSSALFSTYPNAGIWVQCYAGGISTGAKFMAAIVTLWAGWFGFRRLPIGK